MFVYLLLCVNEQGNESHKIGFSKNNPNERVLALSTGNPNKISVLRTYQSKNYIKIEKWLHRKFANKNIQNEWFILNDNDVLSFLINCKEIDEQINYLKENNHFYK